MADSMLITYGVPLALLVLSPFIGGILIGIDRKVTARLQNRSGPPIVQPFYDVLKLFGKEDKIVNKAYLVFGAAYLLTVVLSLGLLLFRYDLLITTFIFGLSFIFLVLAGYSTRSQFGHIGATRELMQMLTYEPILLLTVFLIRLVTGSFEIGAIYGAARPLLFALPLALLAIFVILPIKARKSPFDIAEAHQEIAQGPETEYAGKFLGLLYVSHFFELFFVLWFVGLFFVSDVALAGFVIPGIAMQVLLMLVAYVFLIVVDNVAARLRVDQMLKQVFILGMTLLILNFVFIVATGRWIA
jgi:ech hydrogenase subunit B